MTWIPVAERLPVDGEWVLCYDGSVEVKVFERTHSGPIFYDGDTYCYSPVGRLSNVTHWMPLPEPPKETHEVE